jgi:hypothetical protein
VKGKSAAESEQARVAATKEILDRGYGKAAQVVVGDPNNPILHRHTLTEVEQMVREELGIPLLPQIPAHPTEH